MLIHTSNHKLHKKKLLDSKQKWQYKPTGLWYATNKEWLNYAEKWLDRSYKYIYLINLYYTTLDKPDKDKVLKIINKDEVLNFTLKYGISEDKRRMGKIEYFRINWYAVEQDYGGLDVTELFLQEADFIQYYERFSYVIETDKYYITWLDTWDVPSGCVWNTKAIKKFKLI